MPSEMFFDSCKAGSKIKTEIVRKYFHTWANVISSPPNVDKVAYIDLYSGPGAYSDGTKSTPIQVLESTLSHKTLPGKVVAIFNDVEKKHAVELQETISKIPKIETLKFKPVVNNETVGDAVVKQLSGLNLIPTLLFVDPFGYKGLSIELIGSVLKDWGCDCIFFFNYNRINAGICNPKITEHINGLFGKNLADELRAKVKALSPDERESVILSALKESLKKIRGNYVQTFRFFDGKGQRTSHYIIFVSKNVVGYKLMKGIMAPLSSKIIDGVSFYEHNPVPPVVDPQLQFDLFPPESLLDILKTDLLDKFKGKTKKMSEIFEEHHINTPYIESNYKEVLLNLEKDGVIQTDPPADKRQSRQGKKTFGDNVSVKFP